jgi:hypothetical protein
MRSAKNGRMRLCADNREQAMESVCESMDVESVWGGGGGNFSWSVRVHLPVDRHSVMTRRA